MTNVFLSRPNWVDPTFRKGLEGFILLLRTLELDPRTIGSTDYPNKSPLDEVIRLMDGCKGAIILGYPQIVITAGRVKDQAIISELRLSTEWNHIEAGLAHARGIPLLVIHHPGVTRGIFDRGAISSFIYQVALDDPDWPLRPEIQGALVKWKNDVVVYTKKPIVDNTGAQVPITLAVASHKEKSFGYCLRCGAIPGNSTSCKGSYTTHNFVPWREGVFCRRCGAVPGAPSECKGSYISHDFSV
ncbi:MAG: hypothetical protein NT014_01880 [Candidatus Omnitrophica bacterium]|nr:hypothetical protein [Candidatus Omnitrophota bacterium]